MGALNAPPRSYQRTVVLTDPSDAYYALAAEIAGEEGIPLAGTIDELPRSGPICVLWVLSPGSFSDSVLARFGVAMRERDVCVSWGIITGSTIELARGLYRRVFSFGGRLARVDARSGSIFRGDEAERDDLDAERLSGALSETDYLVFSGHGGATFWRLDDAMRFGAERIPHVPPVVVTTGACSTFRPWVDGSIALAFADRGAAMYAGFVFSPAPYYLIGHPDGFPLRYTWPDFPAGLVAAAQNAGAMKGFAALPFYHLLGDPRLAFRSGPPYELEEDREAGDFRTLVFTGAPAGFVPVRVAGGAAYEFVEIVGVASESVGDFFYNGRLQTLRAGGDLLLLFEHRGGDFTVRLERKAHPLRPLKDGLLDALDHAYVFLPSTNGTTFLLIVSACVLFGTVWFTMRKGFRIRLFGPALATGVGIALLKGIYALVRVDRVSIVSYDCAFNPYFVVGASVLAGCGIVFFFNVCSRFWRGASLLVATFPTWAIAGFWLAGIAYINLFGASPGLGTPLYRYSIGLLPAIAFTVELVFLVAVLAALERCAGRR